MNKNDFQLLYEYNRWANARLCEAVAALSAAQFTQDLGSSYSSVRATLVHIMWAEWIWLKRWQGQSPKSMFDPADFASLVELRAQWDEIEGEQMSFIHGVTEMALRKTVAYQNLRGETWYYPLKHMMQHPVNHSTYHRGQVITMLRQLGAKPVATDFLAFLDERNNH